ncbi:MAG: hypothetical protein KAR31_10800 [Candidatus Omnitrophica bacterium]|nr:hypothetical protein [Candidatus Omnitrophota bacterium]MCK5178740.1 hypothetical protein [Candidatus Omnitrophota bacterium]
MNSSQRRAVFILLVLVVFSMSGCATLGRMPGALLGGMFKLVGKALSIAKQLPWWMWI